METPENRPRSGTKKRGWLLFLMLGLSFFVLIIVAVGVTVYFVFNSSQRILEQVVAPPPRSDFSLIDACRCQSDVALGPEAEELQLAWRFDQLTTRDDWDRLRHYSWFQFYLDISGQDSWYLPITETTSPPSAPTRHYMNLFFACDGDIVAIASEDRATGWNARSRQIAWTTSLGSTYHQVGYEPPKEVDGRFSIQCTSNTENQTTMTLTTDAGEVTLNIADGTIVVP